MDSHPHTDEPSPGRGDTTTTSVPPIPPSLLPKFVPALLEVYNGAIQSSENRHRFKYQYFLTAAIGVIKHLFRDRSSLVDRAQRFLVRCRADGLAASLKPYFQPGHPEKLFQQEILRTAFSLYKNQGLLPAIRYVAETTTSIAQRSRSLESLAEAVFVLDQNESLTVFWIAYVIDLKPENAERIARKIFKFGNISGARAILDNMPPKPLTRIISEIRLSARLLEAGIAIPPRKSRETSPKALSIAYVASSALPFQMAGYTVRTQSLLRALLEHDVHVRCYTRPGYPWDRRDVTLPDDGVLENIVHDNVQYNFSPVDGIMMDPENYLNRMGRVLEQRISADMPTLVHAASNHMNAIPALLAARRLGVPFIYEMRGLWELTAASRKPHWENTERFQLAHSLELLVAREADLVFTITQGLASEIVQGGIPSEKVKLLPNSVDSEYFKPIVKDPKLAEGLGLDSTDFVLVYVGSLTDYEGLDDLIEAVGLLRVRGVSA